MKEFTSAFVTKWNASALGTIYNTYAPETAERPYAVFEPLDDEPDNTMGENNIIARIGITLFDNSDLADTICNKWESVRAAFNKTSFTISGYAMVLCTWSRAHGPVRDADSGWFYEIDISAILDEV